MNSVCVGKAAQLGAVAADVFAVVPRAQLDRLGIHCVKVGRELDPIL